ncbi:hypothetical protein J4227_04650 [Candidatus Woesearchaeota archaeon]|nr:hypothetical protein [Candidatus Woesearchaeota archaeon]
MGHTVWSQRMMVDIMLAELREFGKALKEEDRIIYEKILKKPLRHVGSIAYANSVHVWAFCLLSIILEQEKRIKEMETIHESIPHGRVQERELDSIVAEDA